MRKRVAVLGFYVFDPVSGAEHWSRLTLPAYYYRYFSPDKKTYIMQAELAVAVAVWYTLPDLLRDRHVLHFIDNVAALAAIVKGYARQADAAVLVNSLHEAILGLRSFVWSEWVPSAANPADWPTRTDKMHLIPASAVFIKMKLPPLEVFSAMLDF